MPDAQQQPLQRVLEDAQAHTWRKRLADAFFDREAKREILRAIREDLPRLIPQLDEDRCRELGDGVIQELCRDASRMAKAAPQSSALAAPPLSGHELEDRIIASYPYPIAVAYEAFTDQDSHAAKFGCLLDTYESLIHFLGAVAVSAYLRTELACAECNRHLLRLLCERAWSTGHLFELLRETVRLAGDCGGELPYPLPQALFTSGRKPARSCQVLESFIELRNRKWGHVTGRAEESFAELIEPNQRRLEEELARMPWLAEWELIRPVAIQDGVVKSADLLNGSRRLRARPFELPIRRADLVDEDGDVRPDRNVLLLVAPDRSRYLPLFPLSLFQFLSGGPGAYFLQRCRWSTKAASWRLDQAAYVAYQSGLPEHQESRGDLAAACLERHIQRLQRRAPSDVEAPRAEVSDDSDHALHEVRLEQQLHLRFFVGREQAVQEIADWIDRSEDGAYLLILGPPGQGKSALMAELARREAERGGCLLHMIKSHRDPARFVPALVQQAESLTGQRLRENRAATPDDLRNSLLRALDAVQLKSGRAVLIIDALDELPTAQERLAFLPAALPGGVRVILTCRPDIPLVQALRDRLRGALQERPLEPLPLADFVSFLERRLDPDAVQALQRVNVLEEVFHRLGGNPLFLQCFAEEAQRRWDRGERKDPLEIDVTALPTTLDGALRSIYNRIRGCGDSGVPTEEGKRRARLLKRLCVAREPLSIAQLADVMAASQTPLFLEECHDDVAALSQWLLDVGDGRFKPWHQGLTDFVREQVLGSHGRHALEEAFCRWLDAPPARFGRYGLRHRPRHLLAAGKLDEFRESFVDQEFIEARRAESLLAHSVDDLAAACDAGELTSELAMVVIPALLGRRDAATPEERDQSARLLRGALRERFGPWAKWPAPLRDLARRCDDVDVTLFLGQTLDMEEQYQEAEALYRQVLAKTRPQDAQVYPAVCVALAILCDHVDRPAEGLQILDELLQQDQPQARYGDRYWWARFQRGIMLRRLGRVDEAAVELEHVRRGSSKQSLEVSALHQLGVIQLERGELDLAEATFRQCLLQRGEGRYDHRRAYEFRRLGQIYLQRGERERALQMLQEAREISIRCGHERYVKKIDAEMQTLLENGPRNA